MPLLAMRRIEHMVLEKASQPDRQRALAAVLGVRARGSGGNPVYGNGEACSDGTVCGKNRAKRGTSDALDGFVAEGLRLLRMRHRLRG